MIRNSKKDFPIFQKNKNLVYLDSASTSQKPQVVIDAVNTFYKTYNANIHRGLYKIAEKATEEVEKVRKKVARFINAKDSSEIVFTHGATEAINIVAHGLKKHLGSETSILLSEMEHHSNIVPWQQMAKENKARLAFLTFDDRGRLVIPPTHYNDTYHYSVTSITHISNVLGTVNPIREIILRARIPSLSRETSREVMSNKKIFIIDAAQSVPHMSINVQDFDCDLLAFSGHKMLAPTGVGILYGKKAALENLDPFILGSQMIEKVTIKETTFAKTPMRLEAGTMPIEAIIGLGAAINYLEGIGMKNIQKHEDELTRYALEKLQKIDGLTIYGLKDPNKRAGIISFNVDGVHAHDVAQILGDMNICIRSGHHCAMPLHERLGVVATARVSFYLYNDEQDIDSLIYSLGKLRKIFKTG